MRPAPRCPAAPPLCCSLRSVFAFGSSAFDCLTPDINRLEWRTDFDCFRDYLEGALLELADAATAAAAAAGAAEARVHHEHSGDAVLLAFVLPDQVWVLTLQLA